MQLPERVDERCRAWGVIIDGSMETESSFIGFGRRGDQPVVLKVVRAPGDEWHSGRVLEAFGGQGMVQVYDYTDGAVLLERLDPGTPLADMALEGRDDEATEILADVMERLSSPQQSSCTFATVGDWGKGFERYRASGDPQVPADLVEQGEQLYLELCASQHDPRLLHGDLQHYNVLFDSRRGWVAIDPKGVIGEIEYEIGASLRNPYESPKLFTARRTIERRIACYEARLKLDPVRALAWGFAGAVLSAIWFVEDGFTVGADDPSLQLATAIRPMLE
jgi:streptomycin 6-kinase